MSAQQGGRGGRPVGLPKTGGRQKGTPNRATLLLRDKLASLGCDPAEELVKIARSSGTPLGSKVDIYSTLMPYMYPKRAFIDDSVEATDSTRSVQSAQELAAEIFRIFGPLGAPQNGSPSPVVDCEPNQAVQETDDED